jgi:anti-sigma B factor antagonist
MEIHVQPFHLESITVGADCAVLRIAGELDLYTAPQLRERVIKLLDDGVRHIVADLREVDFLDSTGLGALVGSLKRLREQDGSLTLVIGTDRILKLFRITGLVNAFALCTSFPEAIAGDQHWQAALAREGRSAEDSTEEWCREHGLP